MLDLMGFPPHHPARLQRHRGMSRRRECFLTSLLDRVGQWNRQRCKEWVQQAGLAANSDKFDEFHIQGDVLVGLTLEHLERMKFAPTRIQPLLDAVTALLADVSITENEGLIRYALVAFYLEALVSMKDLERPIADVLNHNKMSNPTRLAQLQGLAVLTLLSLCKLTVRP